MLSWAVILLAGIVLIVFLVLSAKTWNWVHIIALFFVFVAAVFWCTFASQIFAERHGWLRTIAKFEKDLKTARSDHREALIGNVAESTGSYAPDSLRGSELSLSLVMKDRGRVWENGSVAQTGSMFELQFPQADPNNPESTTTNVANLKQDMIVFAFKHRPEGPKQVSVPVIYQGAFHVVNVNGNVVQLEPVQDLGNIDVDPTGQWGLYEKMPSDEHGLFKEQLGFANEKFDAEAFRSTLRNQIFQIDNIYSPNVKSDFVNRWQQTYVAGTEAEMPDDAKINQMLQEQLGVPNPNAAPTDDPTVREKLFDTMLDQYVYDQLPFSQINELEPGFQLTDENAEIDLRLLEDSKPFKVDSTGSLESSGRINASGEVVDPLIQHGGDVILPKDRVIRVAKAGQAVITDNVRVEELTQYYNRSLHDYAVAFPTLTDVSTGLNRSIERAVKQNRVFQATLDDANAQLTTRTALAANLDADSKQFQKELETITQMAVEKHAELQKSYEEFQNTYKLIGVLHAELKDAVTKLKKEIDQRSGDISAK